MITNKQIGIINIIEQEMLKDDNIRYLEQKIIKATDIILKSEKYEIAKDIIGYWNNPNLIIKDYAKFWIKTSQRLYIDNLINGGLKSNTPAPKIWPYIATTLMTGFGQVGMRWNS